MYSRYQSTADYDPELNKAIEDVYSQQGIEYKKRLMMDGIDL